MSVIYGPAWERVSEKRKAVLRHDADYQAEMARQKQEHGDTCTYCGMEMTFPAVYWMASGMDVWLHPPCVVRWMIRLMRDVHEVECSCESTTRDPFATQESGD